MQKCFSLIIAELWMIGKDEWEKSALTKKLWKSPSFPLNHSSKISVIMKKNCFKIKKMLIRKDLSSLLSSEVSTKLFKNVCNLCWMFVSIAVEWALMVRWIFYVVRINLNAFIQVRPSCRWATCGCEEWHPHQRLLPWSMNPAPRLRG